MQLCRVCCRSTWKSAGSSRCSWCLRRQVSVKTRCNAKPDVSPPGYTPSRLRAWVILHALLLPAPSDPRPLLLLPHATAIWRMSLKLRYSVWAHFCGSTNTTGCHGNVSGEIVKQFFRFIIYIHRSNNPANLAKIGSGSLDVDIIGLTEFVDKIDTKIRNRNRTQVLRSSRVGQGAKGY